MNLQFPVKRRHIVKLAKLLFKGVVLLPLWVLFVIILGIAQVFVNEDLEPFAASAMYFIAMW